MHVLLGFSALATLVVVLIVIGWGMGYSAASRKFDRQLAQMDAKYQREVSKKQAKLETRAALKSRLPWRRSAARSAVDSEAN
jgi:hypothetical protein